MTRTLLRVLSGIIQAIVLGFLLLLPAVFWFLFVLVRMIVVRPYAGAAKEYEF